VDLIRGSRVAALYLLPLAGEFPSSRGDPGRSPTPSRPSNPKRVGRIAYRVKIRPWVIRYTSDPGYEQIRTPKIKKIVPMTMPTPNQISNGIPIAPEFLSGLTSNNTNAGSETKSSMQPIMIGRKSCVSPLAIDHLGHFMRAFLDR
jgi:hypothetical protein